MIVADDRAIRNELANIPSSCALTSRRASAPCCFFLETGIEKRANAFLDRMPHGQKTTKRIAGQISRDREADFANFQDQKASNLIYNTFQVVLRLQQKLLFEQRNYPVKKKCARNKEGEEVAIRSARSHKAIEFSDSHDAKDARNDILAVSFILSGPVFLKAIRRLGGPHGRCKHRFLIRLPGV